MDISNVWRKWKEFYGDEVHPIGYELRESFEENWFRIHSLPRATLHFMDGPYTLEAEIRGKHDVEITSARGPEFRCKTTLPAMGEELLGETRHVLAHFKELDLRHNYINELEKRLKGLEAGLAYIQSHVRTPEE